MLRKIINSRWGASGLLRGLPASLATASIFLVTYMGIKRRIRRFFPDTEWTNPKALGLQLLATYTASFLAYPFDTIRVRLSTDRKGKYCDSIHCIRSTYGKSGIRGFYRGIHLPLIWCAMSTIGLSVFLYYADAIASVSF